MMSTNLVEKSSRQFARALMLAIVALIATSAFGGTGARAYAGTPSIFKQSVTIRAWRFSSYWRNDKAESPEWDTWSWVPRLKFQIIGPVEGGSQMKVEYTLPNGKVWFWHDLYTEELQEGYWNNVETGDHQRNFFEKVATLQTGVFGYKITMTNELTGRNDVLLSGKFKVGKVHVGIPSRPNEFEYYVDHDWRMPMATAWLDLDENAASPPLRIGVWQRGSAWQPSKMTGYLMYNGKPVGNFDGDGATADTDIELETMGNRDDDPQWVRRKFSFYGVRGSRSENLVKEIHYLDENPGDYELKVLYSGKLVRSMKFTVDADGKIVDNGFGTEAHPEGTKYIIPVKITGELDGKWDTNAWKTEAFYGNPYPGFTAIPPSSN